MTEFAGSSPSPWLVMLIGAPAAGKTSVARALLGHLAPRIVPHLRTDALRRSMIGTTWNSEVRLAVYDGVLALADSLVRRGLPALLDGNYLDPAQRQAVEALARTRGILLVRVLVHCSLASRLARNRVRDAADLVPDERVARLHAAAEAVLPHVDFVINTDDEPSVDGALRLYHHLQSLLKGN